VRTRKGCVTQFIVISTVQLSSLTLQTSMQVREVNLSYYGAVYRRSKQLRPPYGCSGLVAGWRGPGRGQSSLIVGAGRVLCIRARGECALCMASVSTHLTHATDNTDIKLLSGYLCSRMLSLRERSTRYNPETEYTLYIRQTILRVRIYMERMVASSWLHMGHGSWQCYSRLYCGSYSSIS
jgi:hypothetical protein